METKHIDIFSNNRREQEAYEKSFYFENCDFKVNSDSRAILTSDNKFVMNCHDYHLVDNLINILKFREQLEIKIYITKPFLKWKQDI